MSPRVQVIGSLNIDFTTVTSRFPGPGETLTAKSLSVNGGGKGANQAVACGRAGFISKTKTDVQVEMIGAVGADDPYYASLLKPTLEKSGVDCGGVKETESTQTGTATIIVDEGSGGENRILIVPGANHEGMKDAQDVHQRAAGKGEMPDVLVLQGEIPRQTVFGLISRLHSKTAIVFNPAPVFPDGIPGEVLSHLAVLVMNETEALQVSENLKGYRPRSPSEDEGIATPVLEDVATLLHRTGVKIIIITLGGRGAFYSTSPSNGELVRGVSVKSVVDTTAAGDTFVGYFSTALARHLFAAKGQLQGFDVAGAVEKANQAAAKCVQTAGAMQSIPWGYE